MINRFRSVFLFLPLILSFIYGKSVIAVADVSSEGLSDFEVKQIYNRLESDLVNLGQYNVTSRQEVDKIMVGRGANHRIVEVSPISGQSFTSLDSLTLTIHNTLEDTLGKGFDGDGDGDPEYSSEDDITLDIATHLLGDFDKTGVIDFYDLNAFVSAWYNKDYTYELGPATGTVPHLIPTYDEQFNIEDLAPFLRMWNWSYAFGQPLALDIPSDGLVSGFSFEKEKLVMTLPETDELISAVRISISCPDANVNTNTGLDKQFTFAFMSDWEEAGVKEFNLARTNLLDSLKTIDLGSIAGERELVNIYVSYEVLNPDGYIISRGSETLDYIPLPVDYVFDHAYPNPFNPVTKIEFGLPENQNVNIAIYDLMGREVAQLMNEPMLAGYHHITWHAKHQASGLYFVRMIAGNYSKVQKVMLLK